MNKLIPRILLFIGPLILGLFILPVNKRLKYTGLENDCYNHGIWIYDRIYNNPDKVDVVFLGSSHTINGINDELISEYLAPLEVLNFGYCRFGRNLQYVLLKEIVNGKNISVLILEVRDREGRNSHPVFPFVASSKDVISVSPLFKKNWLSDIWKNSCYKIELLQNELYHESPEVSFRLNPYGHSSSPDTASSEFLTKEGLRRDNALKDRSRFSSKFHNNFSMTYLRKISRVCKKNNISLYFLYLPSYRSTKFEPQEINVYESIGHVLIAPKNLYKDKNNWYDGNHLNSTGANKLSNWIAEEIKIKIIHEQSNDSPGE